MKIKLLVLIFCLVLTPSANAQSSDTLIWSLVGGDISTLNPVLATDGNSVTVINAIYEGLFRTNPETGLPEPGLTSWTISDDGLEYTFTIRDDAQWSDGTPITSADVKFTYEAILSDLVESPRKQDVSTISSVEIIDDKTFVIKLAEPNCTVWG
ncbi:MAG: ABC transporter substrate-binding protein, partial [Aggregatilineales bacterium]